MRMMSETTSTDALIETLTRDSKPIRRLAPPMMRALLWLSGALALSAVAVLGFDRLGPFLRRAGQDPAVWAEMAGAFGTGVLAVIAAFHVSLPDRSSRWLFLPVPTMLLWIVGGGAGCWRDWDSAGRPEMALGESGRCMLFILGIGLPLGLAALLILRRARPLFPERTAIMGGLGAAALAAFLLEFFHPITVTLMDLAVHALAVALVIAGLARTRLTRT